MSRTQIFVFKWIIPIWQLKLFSHHSKWQTLAENHTSLNKDLGESNGTPLQYSCLENPMDGGAWWAAVHGVAKNWTWLSNFTFTFHFCALEKEMATHSSVLAWRIPGMGSHRVGHDWSDLAAVGNKDLDNSWSSMQVWLRENQNQRRRNQRTHFSYWRKDETITWPKFHVVNK